MSEIINEIYDHIEKKIEFWEKAYEESPNIENVKFYLNQKICFFKNLLESFEPNDEE